MSPDWSETDAYRDEHARLSAAADHIARAVAELVHASQRVGDHASAVALRDAIEFILRAQGKWKKVVEEYIGERSPGSQ